MSDILEVATDSRDVAVSGDAERPGEAFGDQEMLDAYSHAVVSVVEHMSGHRSSASGPRRAGNHRLGRARPARALSSPPMGTC